MKKDVIKNHVQKEKISYMSDNDKARAEQPATKKRYQQPQMVTYGTILEFTHGGPMSNAVSDNLPPPGQHKSN